MNVKIFSTVISLIFAVTAYAIPEMSVIAQDDENIINLYNKYYENDNIIQLNLKESFDEYSIYTFTEQMADYGKIVFSTDSEVKLDFSDLMESGGYDDSMFSVSSYFSEKYGIQSVTMNFFTLNHETNYNLATKINDEIKENYNLSSSFVCLDGKTTSGNNKIIWTDLYIKDEFGFKSPLSEELTKKQIEALNAEISENNLSAVIDTDTGKVTFTQSASEYEKFKFVLWIKEKYGYDVQTISDGVFHLPEYHTIILHYTDLQGDVNNDNKVNISDAVMMQRFILGYDTEDIYKDFEYICFNGKNADLVPDNRIDSFDLVLLRQQIIKK